MTQRRGATSSSMNQQEIILQAAHQGPSLSSHNLLTGPASQQPGA